MFKANVIFDLDDTLIHCNKYFYTILDQFCMIMRNWFNSYSISISEIKKKQMEIDIAGIDLHGFKMERFPHSLIETYHFFSNIYSRPIHKSEENTLLELGYSVFQTYPEPYPYLYETLSSLQKSKFRLYLYTGGDDELQWKKIRLMNLVEFFENRIHVVLRKNHQSMERFLSSHQLNRRDTWMIGNSMKTDIIPAVHAGIHSIYIPTENEWIYNQAELDILPFRTFIHSQSLAEVPQILTEYYAPD